MKKLLLLAFLTMALYGLSAQSPYNQKARHTNKGGHYVGGKGSSHKGGHYVNHKTDNLYIPNKKYRKVRVRS